MQSSAIAASHPEVPRTWQRWVRPLVAALLFLYAMSVLVPVAPKPAGSAGLLDDSWLMVLHDSHRSGRQFGSDIVFTYGPWGFIVEGYHPATHRDAVLAWALMAAAFTAAGWSAARRIGYPFWGQAAWFVALVLFASMRDAFWILARWNFFLAMSGLLLLWHFRLGDRRTSFPQVLLAIALGLASLTKFTVLVLALVPLLTISADQVIRRRLPWLLPVFFGSLVLFWLLAGQRLGSLWPFLRVSFELSAKYSETMAADWNIQWAHLAVLIGGALLLLAGTAVLEWPRERWRLLLPASALAGMIFVTLKSALVRSDWAHITVASDATLLLGVLHAPLLARLPGRAARWWCAGAAAALLVAGSWMIEIQSMKAGGYEFTTGRKVTASVQRRFPLIAAANLARRVSDPVADAPGRIARALAWPRTVKDLAKAYKTDMAKLRRQHPLPPLTGTCDIYSRDQAAVLAHGLKLHPRPVYQSYCVFTDDLAERNARHLQSPAAPDWLFLRLQPIDVRYPALEDSLSWLEMLARYEPQRVVRSYLLLKKSQAPRRFTLTPLRTLKTRLDRPIAVPGSGKEMIWVQIDVQTTLAGRLRSQLWKLPPVYLVTSSADGKPRVFCLPAAMAQTGFLLSPTVISHQDFARLYANDWPETLASKIPQKIRVSNHVPGAYAHGITVTFYRLAFSD